jgi:serine/threonine-protein kinase
VTLQGRAKILDFGIAKLASEDRQGPDPTRAGSLLGTPHYMSPEQAQSRPVDARADLYGIGVILYEGTTGRKPFTGSSVYEILRGHIEVPPTPPRHLVPDLSPAVEQVILRALAKEPVDRWQSAHDLAAALSAACQALAAAEWDGLTSRPRNESVGPPTPASTPVGAPTNHRRTAMVVSASVLATSAVAAAIGLAVGGGGHSAPATSRHDARPAIEVAAAVDGGHAATAGSVLPAGEHEPAAERGVSSEPAVRPEEKRRSPAASDAVRGAVQALAPGSGATPPAEDGATPRGRHALDDRISQKNPTPAAWDVTGYVPKAVAIARSYFPDAVLVRIDANGVYPTGKANLELDSKFDVLYRFMSPSAPRRPKDLPLGVEHKPTCMLYVLVSSAEISVYTLKGWSCETR